MHLTHQNLSEREFSSMNNCKDVDAMRWSLTISVEMIIIKS